VGPRGGAAAELYDKYYERTHFETSPLAVASLARLVASAERYRQTGGWLDVGYGAGGLLAIAEGFGWACYGTEVSPRALEYGRKRGWVVTADAGADPRFGKGTFDVVTMIELIEHVTDPLRLLDDAAAWIRPGGLLYLTTPNARSLNRWLLGPAWNVFSPPEHLTIWTTQSLGLALGAAGFRRVRIRAEGFNPCEVMARVRGRGEDSTPANRSQVALELNEFLSQTPLLRAVKRGINMGLAAFGIGDGLKVWAVRSE
jgi:SAM-dependent methyltransferase